MHWFIDPIKNHYADFDGRIGRQEYWMFVLFYFLTNILLEIISIDVLAMLVSLALIVPSFAMGARRLHDIGKSGWWQLLVLVPIIGWIILIVWCATKTEPIDNMYGVPAVPKMGPEGSTSVTQILTAVSPTAVASDSTTIKESDTQSNPEQHS
jgi:uncharacterized membrane protein YhaH (DUF805 family)